MYKAQSPADLFVDEIKKFTQTNGWVFGILILSLGIIFSTNRGNTLGIAVIFFLHFIADILVMMMVYEYSQKNYLRGTWYQVSSKAIFFGIALYTGLAYKNWHYFSADAIYILSAFKNYLKDVKHKDLQLINYKTNTVLSFLIVIFIYIPNELVRGFSQWTQTVGLFLFAIALSITHNEKKRYILSILGLLGMVGGSAGELLRTWTSGEVIGLSLSYFLLPLAVLITYLRLWEVYFKR